MAFGSTDIPGDSCISILYFDVVGSGVVTPKLVALIVHVTELTLSTGAGVTVSRTGVSGVPFQGIEPGFNVASAQTIGATVGT